MFRNGNGLFCPDNQACYSTGNQVITHSYIPGSTYGCAGSPCFFGQQQYYSQSYCPPPAPVWHHHDDHHHHHDHHHHW